MQLQAILRLRREQHQLTQAALAAAIHVTPQAVSKWEAGTSVPSVDNLLALGDLYNLSLDELVQAGPYFKKPHRVGKRYCIGTVLWFLPFWALLSYVLASFTPAPTLLGNLILAVGLVVAALMLPNDYWVIEQDAIVVVTYPSNPLRRLRALFRIPAQRLPYGEITGVALHYNAAVSLSPLDIWRDGLVLSVTTATGTVDLDIVGPAHVFLPQFVQFLDRQRIPITDTQDLLPALVRGDNLYAKAHQND